ncbi:MAG TPA: hypothetical protein VGA02_11930 [Gemmatimonadales bacterium]|jgi:hypothetical protein
MPLSRVATLAAAIAAAPAPPLHAQANPAFESWNLGYVVPAGWQLAQQVGRVHGLAAPSGALIYVAPGMYQSFTDVAADLAKGFFQALGLTGTPMGPATPSTIKGMQAMTARYLGQNQMGMSLRRT